MQFCKHLVDVILRDSIWLSGTWSLVSDVSHCHEQDNALCSVLFTLHSIAKMNLRFFFPIMHRTRFVLCENLCNSFWNSDCCFWCRNTVLVYAMGNSGWLSECFEFWVSVLNCTHIHNVRIILMKDCKIMVIVFCHVQFMQAVIWESPSNYIQYCNMFYPLIQMRFGIENTLDNKFIIQHGHQKQNRGMGVGSNLTINFFLAANQFKNKKKGNKSKVYGKMWGRHIVVDHSRRGGGCSGSKVSILDEFDLQFLVLFCNFIYAALFRFSIDFKKSFVLWYLSLIDFQIFLRYILVRIKFYNICNYSFEYTSTVKFQSFMTTLRDEAFLIKKHNLNYYDMVTVANIVIWIYLSVIRQ